MGKLIDFGHYSWYITRSDCQINI